MYRDQIAHIAFTDKFLFFQDGQTFLMVACQVGDVTIIHELLEHPEVDVNAVDNVSRAAR